MSDDPLLDELRSRIGLPMSSGGPAVAPDAVNLPMIRHWVDAFADHNPLYLDDGPVAPPAMLQTWTMARPTIGGLAERGGAAGPMDPDSPLALLADAGFTGTLATNSELEFERYLSVGDQVRSTTELASISPRKSTAVGEGYFVTWLTTYVDQDDQVVGRQRFRILKFRPGSVTAGGSR